MTYKLIESFLEIKLKIHKIIDNAIPPAIITLLMNAKIEVGFISNRITKQIAIVITMLARAAKKGMDIFLSKYILIL